MISLVHVTVYLKDMARTATGQMVNLKKEKSDFLSQVLWQRLKLEK